MSSTRLKLLCPVSGVQIPVSQCLPLSHGDTSTSHGAMEARAIKVVGLSSGGGVHGELFMQLRRKPLRL